MFVAIVFQEREYSSLVVVRNTCLGEDRLSRRYWRLQVQLLMFPVVEHES